MTSRDFCYWLQGFFEISNVEDLDARQTEVIKRHLNLVFKHEIDPSMGDQKHQDELNAIHNRPHIPIDEIKIPKTDVHGKFLPGTEIMRC